MATQQVGAARDVGYVDTSRYERIEGQLVERPLPGFGLMATEGEIRPMLVSEDGTLEAGDLTVSRTDGLRHEE